MRNEMKSYIFKGDKTLCTGCGACVQVCPHQALSMKPDNEGFLFPSLDRGKCIECGLCDKTCPVVGDAKANQYQYQEGYLSTTNEKRFYKESASIGICTMLSEYIIDNGGVVFGCFLDEKSWKAYQIPITTKDELNKIRNSKYLQSDTCDSFSAVKELLKSNKTVLYIGTPCQIAGLKAYLNRDYSNLFTVDIICHGVFSPKLMPLEINYWEAKFQAKITNFRFRSKRIYKNVNGGMVNFDAVYENGKVKHIERHATSSPSYRAYAYSGDGKNHNLRLACYTCHFRAQERYGDVTVGDPWFINNSAIHNKMLDCNNSIRSLYFINSKKGKDIIEKVIPFLITEKHKMVDLFTQPALIPQTREVGGVRFQLYSRIDKEDYGHVIEDLFHCDLDKSHKRFVINYCKGLIKKVIKHLIGKR